MSRAVRALVWKEWREQRNLLVSGLLLCAVIPALVAAGGMALGVAVDRKTVAEALPLLLIYIVCPLFCAAAGASTIAGEIGEGTLGFLLSRPVARSVVWCVKVGMAAAICLLVAAGALGLSWLNGAIQGVKPFAPLVEAVSLAARENLNFLLAGGSAVYLLFCCAVFCSGLLARPMTAAAAALVAWAALLAGFTTLWSRLDLVSHREPEWFASELFLAGTLVLAASMHLFVRGETLRGRAARRRGLLGAGAALLATLLGSMPFLYARTRLLPEEAILWAPSLSPGGEGVLATATRADGASPQVWLVHPSGGDVERLTGRLAYGHAVSPDGSWIAYLSQRGWFGMTTDDAVLWVARADGAGARGLAPVQIDYRQIAWIDRIVFSPDSKRLATLAGNVLIVADVSGDRPAPPRSFPLEAGKRDLLGWTASGSEILLLALPDTPPQWRVVAIEAVDPNSGRSRPVYTSPQPAVPPLGSPPIEGWARIPLWFFSGEASPRPFELVLIDPETGGEQRIAPGACFGIAQVGDDDDLVYATCSKEKDDLRRSTLRRRDLATGADAAVATVEGRIARLLVSPDGGRLLVTRQSATDTREQPAVLITEGGRPEELQGGWTPLGWAGRHRIVLADSAGDARRLAVLDLTGGELRPFFP